MSVPLSLFAGKVCIGCSLWYPLESFWGNRSRHDGRVERCRYCSSSKITGPDPLRIDSVGRVCSKCLEYKPFSAFDKGKNPGGYRETCKPCRRVQARASNERKALEQGRVFHPLIKLPPDEKRRRNTERALKWQRDFPAKVKAKYQNRRARIASCEGSFTEAEWIQLCIRYRHRCLACGERKRLFADHVIPVVKNGSNFITNIQPLCHNCNSSKYTKSTDYRPSALKRLGRSDPRSN